MDHAVRILFQEVADLAPSEREKVFSERGITAAIRAEIENLLQFDSQNHNPLTGCVSQVAEQVLSSVSAGGIDFCGPYRLLRLLGSGGMGSVYLAERSDREIQHRVAIKLLRAGSDRPSWQDRFLKERQFLANLNHPSVARLVDAGRTGDGRPYLVMEFVDGSPIDVYASGKDLREQLTLFLRVCDGVAHAHKHLIVHRDLKPSNIVVDGSGQPKLLDFGIAKLLDETGDATETLERLLTPNYASPEQLCGSIQTTATDIYSLGAVLYKILAGRSPHESEHGTSQALKVIAGSNEIPPVRRLNPKVPIDVECILRKTLRREPADRYGSVEELAGDIRAFLASRPVQARSGDIWYRTRKFMRRHWLPVTAAGLASASLMAGLLATNWERAIAESRFQQVRQIAGKFLQLDDEVRVLPGATKARQRIVSTSLEYLEGLQKQVHNDPDLSLEIAANYEQVARVQGVPSSSNLGDLNAAESTLRQAESFAESVLSARPNNRSALLLSADIAQDRMIVADTALRRDEARAQARKAVTRIEALTGQGNLQPDEIKKIVRLYHNIALAYANSHLYEDASRYARRAVDFAGSNPSVNVYLPTVLSLLADTLRDQGDLEGALKSMREAEAAVGHTAYAGAELRLFALYNAVFHEGVILGEDGDVNLGRPGEAIAEFRKALDLAEQAARADPNDSASRARVAEAGRELGFILRHRDPQQALATFDLVLSRLREIKNNVKARRDEVYSLTGSAFALRRLQRDREARQRIDQAFRLADQVKDYPTEEIAPGSVAEVILRARADDYADTGDPERAAVIYGEILRKLKANPQTDLRHANTLSRIYQNLAALDRRTGRAAEAKTLDSNRLELWRAWDRKLPGNVFVRRQLEAVALPGRALAW